MKKEQIFLVASLGIAGLLVYGATGRYEPVNADRLSSGKDVPTSAAVPADPRWRGATSRRT